jgi:hypothetical protein
MRNPTGEAISEEIRWTIIAGKKKGHSHIKVGNLLKVTRQTVAKWWGVYTATGGVAVSKKTGRKAKVSLAFARKAYDLLVDGQQRTATEVAQLLSQQGFTTETLHRTTVARAAKKYGKSIDKPIHCVAGAPVKALTVRTRAERLKFAKENAHRDWRLVMFSDRKKFHWRYPGKGIRRSEWKRVGEKRVAFKPNNPNTYNVHAAVTPFGATPLVAVTGTTGLKGIHLNKKGQPSRNITQSEYQDVVMNHLLLEGSKIFGANGVSTWFFQQDNDPSHSRAAQSISKWNARHHASVQFLPKWPPNSPDLSPIENYWGWVQAKVEASAYDTFTEFKAAVDREVRRAPKHIFTNYFKSMSKRMSETIELEGGKTKY